MTTLCERDCTNKSKAGLEPEIATDGDDSGDDDDKMPLSMMADDGTNDDTCNRNFTFGLTDARRTER